MTRTNNDARHMNQYASNNNGMRGRIVAIALAGVLAVGGVAGAVCAAGLGKAPNQAPVAAQIVTTRPATKAASTQKVAKTKKAEAKKATETKKAAEAKQAEAVKPAAKQAEATKQAAPAATKQAEAVKPAAKQAAPAATKQAETKAPTANADGSGLEAKISREDCIAKACAHVGAGGQAKGEAKNVTAKKVVGGGTVYYSVELDLGDVHYCVQVDAIDGDIIGSDQVHAGTRTLLGSEGNPIEGTAQEA